MPEGFQRHDSTSGDVIHIGEVTRLLAITKNDHRPRLANPLDEPKNTHVRTTRKTIDREVPQNRNIDTVKMMVAVTKRPRHPFSMPRTARAAGSYRYFLNMVRDCERHTGWKSRTE